MTLPVVPAHCESAYHMFYVLMPDRRTRDAVLVGMREHGVQPTFHYVPLHSSDAGRRFAARRTECPVTDDISGRLLRLPVLQQPDGRRRPTRWSAPSPEHWQVPPATRG